MTPLDHVPISSFSWFIGGVACLLMGVKSLQSYRHSRVELSKYITWFSFIVGVALVFFSVPSFFTLDLRTLRLLDMVGEGFFYGSMIAQAAIVWCLILRSRIPMYVLTVPVGLLGLASWLYAIPKAIIYFSASNFITYLDPRFSTLVIATLMIFLFVPVGIYFLRLAPRQSGFKAVLNSVIFGMVYLGIGLTNGGFEIATGQVMTHTSVFGITLFFIFLLIGALWPRRSNHKPAVQIPAAATASGVPGTPVPSSSAPPAQSPLPPPVRAMPPVQDQDTPDTPDDQDNLTAPPGQG
ncbi:MAG TPA: hypothetical protein VMU97_00220 [Candidatus Dormibacteraeota bacterium]|nr:hypothetical protein [Candidatus Dormibacteraeota bacterium]